MSSSPQPPPRQPSTSSKGLLFAGADVGLVVVVSIVVVIALRGGDDKPTRDDDDRRSEKKSVEKKEQGEKKETGKKDDTKKDQPDDTREPRGVYEDISNVQTWEAAKGPYLIANEITVWDEAGLRIERGALVLVADGASLIVHGRLETYGDEKKLVRFRSQREGKRWGGIHLYPYGQNRVTPNDISHLDVRGANVGLYVQKVPVKLTRCVFAHNERGVDIQTWDLDERRLLECLVTHNTAAGLRISGKHSMSVTNCGLTHNGGPGVLLENSASPVLSYCELADNEVGLRTTSGEVKPELKHCNITGNRKAAIDIHTTPDIKCDRCWWGTQKVDEVAATLLDGRKTPGRGKVIYEPVWAMPFKLAGTKMTLRER